MAVVTVVAAVPTAAAFAADPVPEDVRTAAVELYGVSVAYGDPPQTGLRDVSMQVLTGGYTAVIGAKGSGKTTLLTVLALLRRPDSGECVLFGEATRGLEPFERARIRRHVEYVAADGVLVPHLTALENVVLGMFTDPLSAAERHARGQALLGSVGLLDRADEPAAYLSGGERGRVAIASALASRPSLLLVDDPDPSMLDAIDAVRTPAVTLVTATRHPDAAERADNVVVLPVLGTVGFGVRD